MSVEPIRVCADTSVFGGVCDEEFGGSSRLFFDRVRSGVFELVVSGLVQREIIVAPAAVHGLFDEMLAYAVATEIAPEAARLRNAYISTHIVTARSLDDARHVALATVSGCAVIVSWNFKHIVNFQKIPKYNAVNVLSGYGQIPIHTPPEVIQYGEEG